MDLAQPGNQNLSEPKTAPALQHQVARVLGRVSLVLACIGIPVLIAVIAYSFWLSAWTRGSMDDAVFARHHAPTDVSSAISPAELQKVIEAAVDDSIKRDELLLDKLLLVVGLYSTILSVLALATVFASRQDAKEQLVSVNAKADALSAAVQQELAAIKAKAQMDFEALKTQVLSEFPIISRLQDRVQNLIADLEDRFPEDEDMNRDLPPAGLWQVEERQQQIQIDESQILAVSVVALDSANLLKLYLALARSYFQRSVTGEFTRGDAARASLYATRATDCNPKSVDAFRLRGASALALYDLGSKKNWSKEELDSLIGRARKDFTRCKEIDPIDAGALYNLALLSSYQGKFDEAIQISETLLDPRNNVPRRAKEKYFPGVYINLGCYFADKWKAETALAEKDALLASIVKICTDGRDCLRDKVRSTSALHRFKENLKKELAVQDFATLPEATKTELETLLKGGSAPEAKAVQAPQAEQVQAAPVAPEAKPAVTPPLEQITTVPAAPEAPETK
jgi:tetratricopeptide (TPR) repeat protein